MKKFIALGATALGAAGTAMALFSAGVAAADDYAGMTYDDASSAADEAGATVIVASRVGSLPDSDCTVERSQNAPFIDGADFVTHVSDTVQFYLNCNGALAGPGKAGNSLQSAAGQAAKAKAEEEAAAQQDEADQLLEAGDEPGATTPDVPTA